MTLIASSAKVANSHIAQTISPERNSCGQILHSSALIGVSSVLSIAIGVVGTKAMAVLLGPAGFGLFAIYNSIAELAQNIAVWVSTAAACARLLAQSALVIQNR